MTKGRTQKLSMSSEHSLRPEVPIPRSYFSKQEKWKLAPLLSFQKLSLPHGTQQITLEFHLYSMPTTSYANVIRRFRPRHPVQIARYLPVTERSDSTFTPKSILPPRCDLSVRRPAIYPPAALRSIRPSRYDLSSHQPVSAVTELEGPLLHILVSGRDTGCGETGIVRWQRTPGVLLR